MELTVAQRLDALLKLQSIDSELDNIKKVRGDLPEEVRDLEDDVIGFETRINKFEAEVQTIDDEVNYYKNSKKEAEKLIGKYKEQQMNVRNNREFDAIAKELELQELEILLAEKRTKEANFKLDTKKAEVESTTKALGERQKDLDAKRKELQILTGESEDDERKLLKSRDKQANTVEERLLKSYNKIRNNALNGLAVVMVKRGACGGCFNMVPPQRQADIREQKKIIVCEHCGRILANVE
jgi:predicted  nucleic acid-binding Zn-ribbon protein